MFKITKGNYPHSYIVRIFGIKIKFRNKLEFQNNKIVKVDKNGKESKVSFPNKKLRVKFLGANAKVKIYEPMPKFNNVSLVCGENTEIIIKSSRHRIDNCVIISKGSNSKIELGENLSIRGAAIVLDNANDISVTIGDDCMIASNVSILPTDFHTVTDCKTGKPLNPPESIKIGNHCWICENATLLKGSEISDDSIVAREALVNKKFEASNIIVGGCPAKIIKENVSWDRRNYNDYVENL